MRANNRQLDDAAEQIRSLILNLELLDNYESPKGPVEQEQYDALNRARFAIEDFQDAVPPFVEDRRSDDQPELDLDHPLPMSFQLQAD